MKRSLIVVLLLSVSLPPVLAACSVDMAMTGKPEPEPGALAVGKSRTEIERQLGTSTSSTPLEEGGRLDVYEYTLGDKPSTVRAVSHGVLDVATLGLWELIGSPMEWLVGDVYRVSVTYDAQDTVTRIDTQRVCKDLLDRGNCVK